MMASDRRPPGHLRVDNKKTNESILVAVEKSRGRFFNHLIMKENSSASYAYGVCLR